MLPPSGSLGQRRVRRNSRFVVPTALPVEVDRRHVQDLITRGVKAKVVSLVAPSGYGKTTALAQWARQQAVPVIWLRLNEEDRDPKTLFADLAQTSALAGVRMETWDRVSLLDLSREQLIAALATDLNAHNTDLTFILDGGEHLGSDAARALTNLLTELGEGHRVLIAQHEASPFSAAPFVARGEGLLISADDLAFTPEDTKAVARQFGAQDRASTAVQEQYQGWPAGVMLALHTQQSSTPIPATALVQEVVNTLPQEVRQVLPHLAVLSTWSAEEARSLGIPVPVGWLDAVLRAGLPLTPLGEGKFAPHDVVRELLTRQLKQDLGLWRTLHLKVGQQAEAQGQPYSAVRHYVQAGREDLAMRLAEELVPRWYRAADWLLAREALEPVPNLQLTAPLRSILALALLETGETERGRGLAQEQLRLFPTPTAHLTLSLDAYRTGNLPAMIQHIEAGLALATEQRDVIQLLRFKAAYLQGVSRVDEGLAVADEAVQRAEAMGDVSLKIATLSVRAYIFEQKQERDSALRDHERAYQAGQQLGLTNRLMPIVDRLALLYVGRDRADEAVQLLENFLIACERTYPIGVPSAQRRLAQVRHAQGRTDDGIRIARQAFDELLRQENPISASDAFVYFFYTELLFGQKLEAVLAFDRLQVLLGEEKSKLSTISWVRNREANAYLSYMDGHLKDALSYLDESANENLRAYNTSTVLTELLRSEIMRLEGQLSRSNADAVAEALQKRPEDVAEVRMVHPYFKPLLQEFVKQGWSTPVFSDLLKRCVRPVESAAPQIQLELATLGRVKAAVKGQEIRLGHVSAIEALVYRVLHPTARQDQLADEVWGGADLKRARQSGHTARSTLNTSFREAVKSLGIPLATDLILPSQGRRNPEWVLNNTVQITCDALTIVESRDPHEVLRLYGGPFLPDSGSEWAGHHREVIHKHVVQVLHEGAALIESQNPQTALAWLVKAADLAQTPEAFERVVLLSCQMGESALMQAAEQAIHSLEAGEVALLSRLYSLN
ncbi:AAA family ATPase [Deinococcus petrolearius]|uniref:AAA family ATPase n=1 Tax=Deinococcus petrolearius TaxID=1751295 RepID=A0ABW1DLU1_9DEIO